MAAAFIALVATSKTSSLTYLVTGAQTTDAGFVANVMKVLVLSITAFAGIELVGCTSAETTDPRRSIPRAIILTLSTIALIYVALCVSVCAAAPYVMNAGHNALVIPGTALQATCPAVATFIAGPIWGKVFTAGVIGSIVTCAFNSLLALSRLSYSMSETRLFPAKFSKLDHQDSVPKDALWFQFWALTIVSIGANIIAHIVPSFDPYTFLGEVFGFLYSFLAILYGVCLISLRYTEPDLLRPFRIGSAGNGLAWFMTVATAMVYGFIAFGCAELNQIVTAVALLLSGLPIYWIYRHSRRTQAADQNVF
jgi:amino acid transporter